jgi:exopolysaccharide production protein ExoQ
MGRLIATFVCALVIWQLFRLNREQEGKAEVRTSKALWLATFWFFIASSRNFSEWLHLAPGGGSERYLEGSPLDRAVLSAVLAFGVIVLLNRARRTGMLLKSNLPILLYFLYCGTSAIWSDFPDVSFKRWFRALGDVVMVLIVLTDPDWVAALRRLLTRLGFVLMPVSILFNRYYPEYGRQFSHAGHLYWTGVTAEKNTLGAISLVFGLAFLFYFLQIYREEEGTHRRGLLIAYGTMVAMALYLLKGSDSATALAGFFLAVVPMVLTFLYRWARKPAFVHAMVFGALGVSCCALFLNIGSGMLEGIGRDATLTGRTAIWHAGLSLAQSPILGTGFESFWVGPRYDQMQMLTDMHLNQVHNGYIEIFLNLGWIGVALLALVLITAYGRIVTALRCMTPAASLRLAYFIIAITQNFTEASFKMMHPVWIAFLLAAMQIPKCALPGRLPPFDPDPADDLTNREPEAAGSYVQLKLGRGLAHRAHRKSLQRPGAFV